MFSASGASTPTSPSRGSNGSPPSTGAPEHVRCDNGPELTANALRDWCRFSGAGSAYIEPGSPWQNPYVESFGSRIRDELLAVEQFSCLAEAQVMVEDFREDYNERRPHSALQMMAPAKFAAAWRQAVKEGKVIPFSDPAKVLRSPEKSPLQRRMVKRRHIRHRGPSATRPPHCCARPTGSLRNAAPPLPFTQTPTTGSHSRWTDERGPVSWPKVAKLHSGYADYQRRTEREIPLVILEPRQSRFVGQVLLGSNSAE